MIGYLRGATMLLRVTPAAVTAPVAMLGTRMTLQFTSTAATYSNGNIRTVIDIAFGFARPNVRHHRGSTSATRSQKYSTGTPTATIT